jgi:hypothetical protein
MDEVEHNIKRLDRRRDRHRIGQVARNPLRPAQAVGKQAAPAKCAHPVAALNQPAAKICANKPAAAEHNARGLLNDHQALQSNPI